VANREWGIANESKKNKPAVVYRAGDVGYMSLQDALSFDNRDEWRMWLEKNHATRKEVWLLHYKKHSKKARLNHFDAVEEALCFGWIDSKLKKIDEERFILKYSPRKPKSFWSKINKEKAEAMIASGKMTQAGYDKIEEAKQNGLWDKAYTSKRKERIPSDLKQALLTKSTAWENFKGFATSYRNMYCGWVKAAKTKETRKRRIIEVVRRAQQNKKPGVE
jgi:uncharacterized protein YdeI (YjbR/CyaY-like superfamily)